MATIQEILQLQLNFTNVSKYHEQGYTGKGIVIWNTEIGTDHAKMTNNVCIDYALDATIVNASTGIITKNGVQEIFVYDNSVKVTFEEFIDKYKVKIITTSLVGNITKETSDYLKDLQGRKNIIMICAAGNDGPAGAFGRYIKYDAAIAVAACYLTADNQIVLASYSGQGDEVDFGMFMGRGSGTSAASPALAALVALLLQKYGDFTQKECVEILKSISIELGEPGKDPKYGWGLPILPLTDKLEILEKLRGEKMADFKDVEATRWSKPAIDRCVNEGLLVGFGDGTFRPTEHVTREQFAQILVRILDKIGGV